MTDEAPILFTDDLSKEVIVWRAVPSTLPSLEVHQVHLWRVSLDGFADEVVEAFAQTLSADEQDRASRFRFDSDRHRFVVGRGALRAILAQYLATPPAHLAFEYGRWGKPSLAGSPAIQFNISHCEDWCLLAVSSGAAVGIDIEKIELPRDYLAIAVDCFDPEQVRMLKTAAPESRARKFCRFWTGLEAACKASGVTLSGGASETRSMHIRHYIPADGYVAAVAYDVALR